MEDVSVYVGVAVMYVAKPHIFINGGDRHSREC